MITTATKVAIGLTCGGVLATVGTISVVLTRQGDQLDVVERYGLLGLHALVVLGLGSAMVKIGWELVRTNRKIGTTLERLVEARKEDRESNDDEREAAVKRVVRKVEDGHDAILQTQAKFAETQSKLAEGMQTLLLDLDERRKEQRRKGDRRGQ
jgi:hypothetical protein